MAKVIHFKKVQIFFLYIFLSTGILSASEVPFDKQYQINITESWGTVYPPDVFSDFWRATHFIHFDNGLYGTSSSRWKHESQAKQVSKFKYSGAVNLIHRNSYSSEESFSIGFEDGSYPKSLDNLWVDKNAKFDTYNHIVSITENIEVISRWFWEEKVYRYVIELSEGTLWQTQPQTSPWNNPWKVGSRILILGNSKCPCFINVDAVRDQSSWCARKQHFLVNLELL